MSGFVPQITLGNLPPLQSPTGNETFWVEQNLIPFKTSVNQLVGAGLLGEPLTVMDGATSVTNVGTLNFTGGVTITNQGSGEAGVSITGSPLTVSGAIAHVTNVSTLNFVGVRINESAGTASVYVTNIYGKNNSLVGSPVYLRSGSGDFYGGQGAAVALYGGINSTGGNFTAQAGYGANGNGGIATVKAGSGSGAGNVGGALYLSAGYGVSGASNGVIVAGPSINVGMPSGTVTSGWVNAAGGFAVNGVPVGRGLNVYGLNVYGYDGGSVTNVTGLTFEGVAVTGTSPDALINMTTVTGTIGQGISLIGGSGVSGGRGSYLGLSSGSGTNGGAVIFGGGSGVYGGPAGLIGGASSGTLVRGASVYLVGGGGSPRGVINAAPLINVNAASGTQNPGDINISGTVRQNGVAIGPISVASGTLTVSPVTQLYIIGGTLTNMGGGVAQLTIP